MRTVIQGGTVVTAAGSQLADIACIEGCIEAVGHGLDVDPEDEVIDATGLHVFPGFIDPHVHARDPGLTHKEDIAHVTRAAAAGGITTVLLMPNTVPPTADAATLIEQAHEHAPSAHIDYGLWALAFGQESTDDLVALRDAGAVAAKLFWGYAFDRASRTLVYQASSPDQDIIPPASTGDVWRLFRSAREAGLLIGVHCEDHAIVTAAAEVLGTATGPSDLPSMRPAVAEATAVAAIIELVHATGARAHIVHASTSRSVELVRRALADGVSVSAETCPHYLTLDPAILERSGLKAYPPVRGAADADALWSGLADGTISSVSSDHAPHASAERTGPFDRRPAGISGVQTMAPVLIDAFLRRDLPLSMLADRLSTGTARLYGLYPRKGRLEPGADADITIIDTSRTWRVLEQELQSKDRSSPWEGTSGRGTAVLAMVRGQVIMRDGKPVGVPTGRWIRPAT